MEFKARELDSLTVAGRPPVGYRMPTWASAPFAWRAPAASWLLALVLAVAAVVVHGLAVHRASQPSPPTTRHVTAPADGLWTLPIAAQSVASAVLGADNPAYRIGAARMGYQARNPAQSLHMRFATGGVQVSSGKLRLGLSLRGVGYGDSVHSSSAVQPSARANRVSYARPGGLLEWYRNGPLGLEQGFTIARAPSERRSGPLTLVLALSGVHARLDAGGGNITLSRLATSLSPHPGANGLSLRYGDLFASDASHRSLPSSIQLRDNQVLLRVDTRGAHYPLRIDPLIQQGEKLTGGKEEREGAFFGDSVALSADGNTALIGGEGDNGDIGAAWVFTRTGSTWTQQGSKLVPPITAATEPADFGHSVALSSDGNVALVGGPRVGHEIGAAWVFTRSDSNWTQGPELTGGQEVSGEARFGESVAMSSDASTLAIGGSGDSSGAGAAWIFVRLGSGWVQQSAKLTDGGQVTRFGYSLALSSDGNTALISSLGTGAGNGAAWVFTRSGSTWVQQGEKLTSGVSHETAVFGSDVALSSDGSTALVGDAGTPLSDYIGGAWVFVREGSSWVEQGPELTSLESDETALGSSVALSSDGNTALIASGRDNGSLGAAWTFRRSGSTWNKQPPRLTGGEERDTGQFGDSVALSSDASTALIGGPGDTEELGAPGSRGAAWAFVSAPPIVSTGGVSSIGEGSATIEGTVNPNGLASTAYFQYGTTSAYGMSTVAQPAGSTETIAAIDASITGLEPETTYHFRILAESSAGISYGADQAFTTPAPPPPPPPIAAPIAPANTVAPVISGTPIRGQALSVSPGAWSNAPTAFAYQWQGCDAVGANCLTLAGASGPTHDLDQADVGRTLRAIVTASNLGGSHTATSGVSPVIGSQVEAAMTWNFGWTRRYTTVESLIVHEIPTAGAVELTCHGRGCPFRDHTAHAASHARCRARKCKAPHSAQPQTEVNLTPLFKNRHLGVGAQITVHIIKTAWIGKSYVFTMRSNHAPRVDIACLALDSNRPGQGC
jgi:hypothetical protein